MHIALVLGTGRAERQSEKVAHALREIFTAHADVELSYTDASTHVGVAHTRPSWGADGLDESLVAWKERAEVADGIVFVVPEYNRGYPGEWKLLVDALDKKETFPTPVFIVGVSSGIFGGARVIEHIKPILVELGFVVTNTPLHVAKVGDKFDKDGTLLDMEEKERMQKFAETVVSIVKKFL